MRGGGLACGLREWGCQRRGSNRLQKPTPHAHKQPTQQTTNNCNNPPGGQKLLTSAVVTLAVLRRALNCTLPIELVWHDEKEMDRKTLAALTREFGPLRGYNVAAAPYPHHHRRRKCVARLVRGVAVFSERGNQQVEPISHPNSN